MLLLRWLLNTLILMVVARLTPGVHFASFWSALVTSLVLGLLNALVRPLIILLTLPINILTLGVFTLFINASIFWLAASIVKGFEIQNFSSAFWGALIYTILVMVVNFIETKS
jgi:putative membrane protein